MPNTEGYFDFEGMLGELTNTKPGEWIRNNGQQSELLDYLYTNEKAEKQAMLNLNYDEINIHIYDNDRNEAAVTSFKIGSSHKLDAFIHHNE
jgi:hypothetical protein